MLSRTILVDRPVDVDVDADPSLRSTPIPPWRDSLSLGPSIACPSACEITDHRDDPSPSQSLRTSMAACVLPVSGQASDRPDALPMVNMWRKGTCAETASTGYRETKSSSEYHIGLHIALRRVALSVQDIWGSGDPSSPVGREGERGASAESAGSPQDGYGVFGRRNPSSRRS